MGGGLGPPLVEVVPDGSGAMEVVVAGTLLEPGLPGALPGGKPGDVVVAGKVVVGGEVVVGGDVVVGVAWPGAATLGGRGGGARGVGGGGAGSR